jgi:hypothetical protein
MHAKEASLGEPPLAFLLDKPLSPFGFDEF